MTLGLTGLLLLPAYSLADVRQDTKSGRVVQVDLSYSEKISQYTDIDSSPQAYGKNGCGLVAAAAAVGGDQWVAVVRQIATAAGDTYSPYSGIQPSDYVSALTDVFGTRDVTARNESSLQQLYQELYDGNIVIVDIKVNSDSASPSARTPNYAHFARVLGMDMNTQEIYIQNTLTGPIYWTLSFQDFLQTWDHPETSVSEIPDPKNVEDVTRWAVVLDSSLLKDDDL